MSDSGRLRQSPLSFGMGALTIPNRRTGNRVWWVLAVIAVTANIALTALTAATAVAPAFAFDEVHQLIMSRMIAGFDTEPVRGSGYYPGWALLIAPLWWLWREPEQFYIASSAVGCILSAVTIIPLTFFAERFRVSRPQAVTIGAIVMTLPARMVQNDFLLSERLLFLIIVLAALAAFRLWESPSYVRALVFGLLIGASYLVHMRALVVVIASGIWVIALARKNWRVAGVGVISVGVFSWVARRTGDFLNTVLLGHSGDQSEAILDKIAMLRPGLFIRVALSQLWGQFVGSYGLFALGAVTLLFLVWRELRRASFGRATWLFGALSAAWLVSIFSWAADDSLFGAGWVRLDSWLYGRYIEPFTALVCVIGLAIVIRGVGTALWALSTGLGLLVVLLVLFWIAPQAPTGGYVTPAHMAGVLPWSWLLPDVVRPGTIPTFTNDNAIWLWASVTALLCLMAYLMLRRASLAATVALGALVSVGVFGVNASADAFRERESDKPEYFWALDELLAEHPDLTIAWDGGCRRVGFLTGVGQNQVGYHYINEDGLYSTFSSSVDRAIPDVDIVLSCRDNPETRAAGALPLKEYDLYDSFAWIMPGDLQDELQEQGRLDEIEAP